MVNDTLNTYHNPFVPPTSRSNFRRRIRSVLHYPEPDPTPLPLPFFTVQSCLHLTVPNDRLTYVPLDNTPTLLCGDTRTVYVLTLVALRGKG